MNHKSGGRLIYRSPAEKHDLDVLVSGPNVVALPRRPVVQDARHVTAAAKHTLSPPVADECLEDGSSCALGEIFSCFTFCFSLSSDNNKKRNRLSTCPTEVLTPPPSGPVFINGQFLTLYVSWIN